jgi:hypothetical protein
MMQRELRTLKAEGQYLRDSLTRDVIRDWGIGELLVRVYIERRAAMAERKGVVDAMVM